LFSVIWATVEISNRKKMDVTIHTLYANLDKVSKDRDFLQAKLLDLKEKNKNLLEEKKNLDRRIKEKDKNITDLKNKLHIQEKKIEEFKSEISKLQEKLNPPE
jgi:chromosome segregation ATPase